jgi:hypothetical protein
MKPVLVVPLLCLGSLLVAEALAAQRFEFAPAVGYYAPTTGVVRSLVETPCSPGPCYDSLRVNQEAGLVWSTRVTAWWWRSLGSEGVVERASAPRHMIESSGGQGVEQRASARLTFMALRAMVRRRIAPMVDVAAGAGPMYVALEGPAYQGVSYVRGTDRLGLSLAARLGVRIRGNLWAELGATGYAYNVRLAYPNENPGFLRSVRNRDLILSAALSLPVNP